MLSIRRAFTMMEILVVIAIVGVLVAIFFAVGRSVTNSAKTRLTEGALMALDKALDAYINEVGENPSPLAIDPQYLATDNDAYFLPVADARAMNPSAAADQMLNSAGLFMAQANPPASSASLPLGMRPRASESAKAALANLPSRLLTTFDPDGNGPQPPLMTPMDGWGRPIRYVHPAFDGLIHGTGGNTDGRPLVDILGPERTFATGSRTYRLRYRIDEVRRNAVTHSLNPATPAEFADSDGGLCTGGKPYFYSAGADGKVGVLHDNSDEVLEDYNRDNVYLIPPTLPKNVD
jgi:prepilin-type N-terminal cleavage/methylation domain-containing protein